MAAEQTEFERFFDGEFQRRLSAVRGRDGLLSRGGDLAKASWDRKAAYLLWVAEGREAAPSIAPVEDPLDDLFG